MEKSSSRPWPPAWLLPVACAVLRAWSFPQGPVPRRTPSQDAQRWAQAPFASGFLGWTHPGTFPGRRKASEGRGLLWDLALKAEELWSLGHNQTAALFLWFAACYKPLVPETRKLGSGIQNSRFLGSWSGVSNLTIKIGMGMRCILCLQS